MHELAVTESILDITLRHAGGQRISDIYLVIGQLASIVDDSVSFYWEFISQGTLAEQARLHFRRIPAELACQSCQHTYAPADEILACPACGSTQVRLLRGDEFFVESIEVESPT
jgi:hydrogenase nickel incorporation protein HypA/HybF